MDTMMTLETRTARQPKLLRMNTAILLTKLAITVADNTSNLHIY